MYKLCGSQVGVVKEADHLVGLPLFDHDNHDR
jgi:hypothetical protein